MKLNLRDILIGRVDLIAIDETIESCKVANIANHRVGSIDDFTISGKVDRLDDKLKIHLAYKGMVHFVCDRCLDDYTNEVSGEIDRQLSERDEFDVEWVIIRDDQIDLLEIIKDDIALNLPIQMVCSDECQGLCSQCGTNLNTSQCKCEEDNIDPRLASLKNLFN